MITEANVACLTVLRISSTVISRRIWSNEALILPKLELFSVELNLYPRLLTIVCKSLAYCPVIVKVAVCGISLRVSWIKVFTKLEARISGKDSI